MAKVAVIFSFTPLSGGQISPLVTIFRFLSGTILGFRKTRYRGIAKNDNKLAVLFALSNIYRLSQLLKS